MRRRYSKSVLTGLLSLNPYSNGICSMRMLRLILVVATHSCLNPYSNGICSMRSSRTVVFSLASSSLNPYSNGICSMRKMQTGSKIVS